MSTTFDRLTEILVRDHRLAADRLTPEAPLESLGIDSLGTVELLWTLEDAFKVKLPTQPVDLLTLGDVVRLVDALVAQQGQALAPPAAVTSVAPAVPVAPRLHAS
jgi:acyl carrier protein